MRVFKNLIYGVIAACLVVPLLAQAQQSGLKPIITYDQEHPLIDVLNILPMVQVYSSGEVVVYRGEVMTNPGRYVIEISAAELAQITALADAAAVLQNELSEILQEADSDTLLVSSDPTTSTFEFNRVSDSNVLSAGDGTTTDSLQTIEIDDVVFTAAKVRGSATVNALRDLHIRLIQLYSQAGQ